MTNARLNDLDELVLNVRDRTSRSYISEAISAYRGGAYRSSIVSTWIAVVYDLVAKLRELAGQGDSNAKRVVKDLDENIRSRNLIRLQSFEDSILESAYKDFEFLRPHEYEDLKRLKLDRNMCAHPAFIAEETIFQPTPELVRAHLVHAMVHLLSHPPLQGKSALERIKADIMRPSFPEDLDSVSAFLQAKYFAYAKEALIRNLVIVLLKSLLRADDPDLIGKENGLSNALMAVSQRCLPIYDEVAPAKAREIVDALDDEHLFNVFYLLGSDPRGWGWLSEPARIRIKRIIQTYSKQAPVGIDRALPFRALDIEELRDSIIHLFDTLDFAERLKVLTSNSRPELANLAINQYLAASNYRNAEIMGNLVLLPMAPYFSPEQITRILEGVKINPQIRYARESPSIIEMFFDRTTDRFGQTADAWKDFAAFLSDTEKKDSYYTYPNLQAKLNPHGIESEPGLPF